MATRLPLAIALIATVTLQLIAQPLATRTITTGLDTPWEILWGPDSWLWVTERPGRISRINPETGQIVPLLQIPGVYEQGESGLLGMALHPNFADSPHVFVAYTYREGAQILERIVRFTYDGTTLADMRILLDRIPAATIHNGCRLLILPDRTLLVTTGDANNTATAQNLQSLNGKVLRLRLDGTIPADNPFPNSPIWSVGHRNAQGLTYHDGILYSSEHGPNNDDEINIIEAGRNYGWPTVMGYCDSPIERAFCEENNVAEPIAAWTPTIAPCGMAYYPHTRIPQWEHSLLLVTLKASRLVVLSLDSSRRRIVSERHFLVNELGRLRAICVSPDGRVFIGTSNRDGRGSPRSGDDRIVELVTISTVAPTKGELDWKLELLPFPHHAQLSIVSPQDGTFRLSIANLSGRWNRAWDFSLAANVRYVFPLELTGLAHGVYAVSVTSGSIHSSRLVVVCY